MDYVVLSPWAKNEAEKPRGLLPRVNNLNGKVIGLYADCKWHSSAIMKRLLELLKEKLPEVRTSSFQFPLFGMDVSQSEEYKAKLEEWLKTVDTVIVGYGDTKSCSLYLSYDSVTIETSGKPVVMLSRQGAEDEARSGASVKGLPGLRIVSAGIPNNTKNPEVIREGLTEQVLNNLIAALTRPLTEAEKKPLSKVEEKQPANACFEGSLEEVNRYFYIKGWSDGLPVIPPTKDAVEKMLQGTDLPADYVVAKLPLRYGYATVEKIAINAVMAGALPTYLPLLIAGVQAMAGQPETRHVQVTPVSVAPCWIINGPVRHDINANSGLFLFNSGIMANSVFARAMQLILKNTGGSQPGIDVKYSYGHIGTSSLAFAENEEGNPWEPLHVELGLHQKESSVSLFYITGSCQVLIGGGSFPDDKALVNAMCNSAADPLEGRGIGMGGLGGGNSIFVVSEGSARLLANNGWTKKKMLASIMERINSTVRPDRVKKYENYWGPPENNIKIIVAGGTSDYNTVFQFQGGFLGWTTRKVELPAKWSELVKKYQEIVPAYAQYLKK